MFWRKKKKPTIWEKIMRFKAVYASILFVAGSLYVGYNNFIKPDFSKFKTSELTVIAYYGQLLTEWETNSVPCVPYTFTSYMDGVQLSHDHVEHGICKAYGESYGNSIQRWAGRGEVIPPLLMSKGEHTYRGKWVFQGWRTLFIPITINFQVDFEINEDGLTDETNNQNSSGFSIIPGPEYKQWI